MGSEGACEPSVSASLCVSGGRVLVCACVCVCARAHQLYVLQMVTVATKLKDTYSFEEKL